MGFYKPDFDEGVIDESCVVVGPTSFASAVDEFVDDSVDVVVECVEVKGDV